MIRNLVDPPSEYTRPWKLLTLAAGMTWLLLNTAPPDWTVGVSLLMGGLTYLTAGAVVRNLYRGRCVVLSLLCLWFTVDLSYVWYHSLAGNEYFRWPSAFASVWLYLLCGILWSPRRTFYSLLESIRKALRSPGQPLH